MAPAVLAYAWGLADFHRLGWMASFLFVVCGSMRLARFNTKLDNTDVPAWIMRFFTGVPAPAGAILAMLPFYLAFLGVSKPPAMLTAAYTLLIAFLMVSRLPVFSGKTVRMRVPPEMVLPVFVSVVFFVAPGTNFDLS